jgi:hypothetical protein
LFYLILGYYSYLTVLSGISRQPIDKTIRILHIIVTRPHQV